MIETKEKIFFGSDYNGGTNFIVESKDCERFVKYAITGSYRRSPVLGMSVRFLNNGYEIWALLHSRMDSGSKSLLMCSRDQGISWIRVIEYNGLKFNVNLCSASNNAIYHEVYFSVTDLLCSNDEVRSSTFCIRDRQKNHS